jgi:hypothetical protein
MVMMHPCSRQRWWRLAVGGIVAVSLLGVGGQAAAAKADPCAVVSASDIQHALGLAPAGPGKRDNMGIVDSCSWDLPNAGGLFVTVFVTMAGTPSLAPRMKNEKIYTPVSGLGNAAVYTNASRPPIFLLSETVEVVAGQRHFDVHYVNTQTAAGPSRGALIALARTILAHLP